MIAAVQREQSDRPKTEQRQRVQVLRPPAQPPVQAGDGRAARVAYKQGADRRSGGHPGAGGQPGSHGFVGRPQPVGVPDGDHRTPGHRAGEEHYAWAGGSDVRARGGGQVDAAVTGQPRLRWRIEPSHRLRGAGERPAEPRIGRRAGQRHRTGRSHGRHRAIRHGRAVNRAPDGCRTGTGRSGAQAAGRHRGGHHSTGDRRVGRPRSRNRRTGGHPAGRGRKHQQQGAEGGRRGPEQRSHAGQPAPTERSRASGDSAGCGQGRGCGRAPEATLICYVRTMATPAPAAPPYAGP